MKKQTQLLLEFVMLIVICLFFTSWWILINFTQLNSNQLIHEFFSYTYGLTALFGAIVGFGVSKQWGGLKSLLGRAILSFSIGLLFQELGQLTYSYQILILKIENPYPSIGDIFFFSTHFFYAYGIWLIAKVSGVNLSLQRTRGKLVAITIPIVMLIFTYLSILKNYELDFDNLITSFFDFGYPTVQVGYISATIMTFMLTKKWLGGKMKNTILLILSVFVVQYISDYSFVYQTLNETWTLSGSNDLFYFISYSLMTFTLIRFGVLQNKISAEQE